jgi:hypothetical protein
VRKDQRGRNNSLDKLMTKLKCGLMKRHKKTPLTGRFN